MSQSVWLSVELVNFLNQEILSVGMRHERYAQSGQYHTIVESRVRLTWYQSHAFNLVVPIDW